MYAATLSGTRPSNGLPFAASARTSVEDTGNTGALANSTVPPSAASPAAYYRTGAASSPVRRCATRTTRRSSSLYAAQLRNQSSISLPMGK